MWLWWLAGSKVCSVGWRGLQDALQLKIQRQCAGRVPFYSGEVRLGPIKALNYLDEAHTLWRAIYFTQSSTT
jgi:hypothetical protein